ncbi:MAG: ABC transporter permease [Lachnospirales bacterium]
MSFYRLFVAEIKLMVKKLPIIFISGVLLIFAVSVFVLGITNYSQNNGGGKSTIAISAPNDTFTQVAVTAIENMESVSKICKFIRVDDKEAEAMVYNNKASAAIIFGDNFVEDIIKGKNTVPRILVSANSNKLFNDLILCGSSMLSVVQAGIYSAEEAYYNAYGKNLSHSENIELNMEYIDTVFSREKYFKNINDDSINLLKYFSSMLIPVLLMLFAMSLSSVIFSESRAFYEYANISYFKIALIQIIKSIIIFGFVFIVLWLILYFKNINISFNFLPVISVSFIITAIYSLADNKVNASFVILVFTLILAFVGGNFIPPSFIGENLREFTNFVPLNIMGRELMGESHIIYDLFSWIISSVVIFIGGKKKCLL